MITTSSFFAGRAEYTHVEFLLIFLCVFNSAAGGVRTHNLTSYVSCTVRIRTSSNKSLASEMEEQSMILTTPLLSLHEGGGKLDGRTVHRVSASAAFAVCCVHLLGTAAR